MHAHVQATISYYDSQMKKINGSGQSLGQITEGFDGLNVHLSSSPEPWQPLEEVGKQMEEPRMSELLA